MEHFPTTHEALNPTPTSETNKQQRKDKTQTWLAGFAVKKLREILFVCLFVFDLVLASNPNQFSCHNSTSKVLGDPELRQSCGWISPYMDERA